MKTTIEYQDGLIDICEEQVPSFFLDNEGDNDGYDTLSVMDRDGTSYDEIELILIKRVVFEP